MGGWEGEWGLVCVCGCGIVSSGERKGAVDCLFRQRGSPPSDSSTLPQRGSPPSDSSTLPQRGSPPSDSSTLPPICLQLTEDEREGRPIHSQLSLLPLCWNCSHIANLQAHTRNTHPHEHSSDLRMQIVQTLQHLRGGEALACRARCVVGRGAHGCTGRSPLGPPVQMQAWHMHDHFL